jgi:eukaryotic-like serine/threonine-protein kinase
MRKPGSAASLPEMPEMTSNRWQQIKGLFAAAAEMPTPDRSSFLLRVCSADISVLDEVQRLLMQNDQTGDFLETGVNAEAFAGLLHLHTFAPDELVSGRFKIVRFIGRGGMGEVYEAEDLELRENIALKTIRTEIAADEHVIARFKQEIQLSRKVTHPNVCRIFDIERHKPPSDSQGSREEVTYLTMEMLPGETLAEQLRRTGRMATEEALPIVTQIIDGLQASHRAGIVHGDLKCSNVVLVSSHAGPVRAVVTDFGLARLSSASENETGATGGTGTPAYMAPEQVERGTITTATDIYSLGIVMFEVVTGTLPFVADTPTLMANKRLEQSAPPPRTIVADLDRRWEAAILRCLERDPLDRFATAADVAIALHHKSWLDSSPGLNRHALRRALALVGLGLALLAAALGIVRLGHKPVTIRRPEGQRVGTRRSVAVLGFKNLSSRPESEWTSTALSEMLSAELAAGEKLRVISGEDLASAKADLSLGAGNNYSADALAHLRRSLGVDDVIVGSYFDSGGPSAQIRLDLRLDDASTAQVITTIAETGAESDLPDLISRVGTQLREKLDAGEMSATDALAVRSALPVKPEAAPFYAEGLQKLRVFDAIGARDLLEKAVSAEPDYPLGHSALAEAWSVLGYETKALGEAEKAFSLGAGLPRERYLAVEARYHEMKRDWNKAIQIYQSLALLYPDNLDYGLSLAATQSSAGNGKDALLTVKALRDLPAPASSDPRIDLAEAQAAESLADFSREQTAAATAVEKGHAIGARLLVARGLLSEGWALDNLGKTKEALAVDREAQGLFAAVGDRVGVARAVKNIADALDDQGDYAGARKAYEQALSICSDIDYRTGMIVALNGVANTLESQGDLEGAKQKYAESLKIARQVGDRRREPLGLNGVGLILWRQGDLSAAKKMFEDARAVHTEAGDESREALVLNNIAAVEVDLGDLDGARRDFQLSLALSRDLNDQIGVARALCNIGDILLNQGQLTAATNRYDEALRVSEQIQQKREMAYALYGLGQVLVARGDLATARERHEEALGMRNQIGEAGTAAESRLAIAELSFDGGHPTEAASLAQQVAGEFRKEGETELEAAAHAIAARSLLVAERPGDAAREIDKADQLLRGTEDREARFLVGIDRARVRAAQANAPEAIAELKPIMAEATKYGYLGYEFEARLALGEIEMKSGHATEGRAHLASLAKEAQAKDFALIARKAREAAQNQ